MLDIMYDVPSRTGIKEVVINEEVDHEGRGAAHRLPEGSRARVSARASTEERRPAAMRSRRFRFGLGECARVTSRGDSRRREHLVNERFTTVADVALQGDVNLAATVATIPAEFMTKGMFFNRYVAALGAEWEDLAPALGEPAKHGRYHAFEHYPMRDYIRVFDRIARARFPGSTREAFRLLARGEVEVFAESTLGKVAFSLLRDPGATLLRYPDSSRSWSAVLPSHRRAARRSARRRHVPPPPRLGRAGIGSSGHGPDLR